MLESKFYINHLYALYLRIKSFCHHNRILMNPSPMKFKKNEGKDMKIISRNCKKIIDFHPNNTKKMLLMDWQKTSSQMNIRSQIKFDVIKIS